MAVTIKGFASDWSVPEPAKAGINTAIDKRLAWVNALTYGYDPTGATASDAAIQAAMDAAHAAGGGTVFIPDGELVLATSLKPRNKVRVICNEGMVRVTAPTLTYAFIVDQPEHQPIQDWFMVEGFIFEGGRPESPTNPVRQDGVTNPGLRSGGWFMGDKGTKAGMPYLGDITYRKCVFKNMNQPIHYAGISGHGVVEGCKFINTLDPSFTYMQNAQSLIYTHNLTLNGGDNGVSVSRVCKNAVISDNVMINCAFNGVWVAGFVGSSETPGAGPDRFVVSDNVIYNCGEGGIALVDAPRYGTVTGNLVDTILRGPLDQPTFNRGYGVRVTGFPSNGTMTQAADTINITGNTFRNIPRAGVSITGARNLRIGENLFVNVGEQYVMNADGTISTTEIGTTDNQYNCGVTSPHSASLTNIFVYNNVFIDERATPLMNYAIPPNLTSVVTSFGNKVQGVRNPHNEPLTAGDSSSTDVAVVVNGKAGAYRGVQFKTAGSNRWQIRATGATETGSNTGTSLDFIRYSDTGSTLGTPVSINRATGEVRFNDAPAVFVNGFTVGNGGTVRIGSSGGAGASIGGAADKLSFYGAAPVAKPSLTYSKTGETAAEAQLRGVLVTLGLVTDSTVA